MNLILMRTKSEHLNVCWEPFATSTPMKKLPNQFEVKEEKVLPTDSDPNLGKLLNVYREFDFLQNKSFENTNLVAKKSRKTRLSTYFNLSSSSDDDSSEITRRPIIKLKSKKSARAFLKKGQPQSEETDVINTNTNVKLHRCLNIKNMHSKSIDKNIASAGKNSKNKNQKAQNKENTVQTCSEINSCTENSFKESADKIKMFNKSKKNKTLGKKREKPCSKNKANSINFKKNPRNGKHSRDINETERKILQEMNKPKLILSELKPVNVDTEQKFKKANKELTTSQKRNNKIITDDAGPAKKKIKRGVNEHVTIPATKQAENTAKPVLTWQNKSNLSHQLFSESTEQEYINTLNLTSDDVNEPVEITRYSSPKGNNSKCQQFIWPYHSRHKICAENKDEGNSNKTKQISVISKKFWSPENQTVEALPFTDAEMAENYQNVSGKMYSKMQNALLSENVNKTLKKEKIQSVKSKKCFLKNNGGQGNAVLQKINVTGNSNKTEDFIDMDNCNLSNRKFALNCSESDLNLIKNIKTNKAHIKDTLKYVEEKNSVNSPEKSERNPCIEIFKQLDDLYFNGNESGCVAVQCLNISNFKCGVFKLKMKSHLTCKTLHSDSHLGGVVIKGSLKMKIGSKEQDLKEGDMAFVPPLTEWQATNFSECESVFYYWCGRFGS